ncbi:MAG: diacylglycerol/lipid kinase family protein [Solirubrobacteraceae bacterium]
MSAPTRQDDPAVEHAPDVFEPVLPAVKRRMLIIVNPYATTVSDRLRNLVVYALQGRYEVDAVDTEARGHATTLCREAAHEGYDVVVAFGGDGTVNEAANGLLGSPTPLTCLPGGSANVFCKMLGIPGELVDATEHLLGIADAWEPRRVDVGVVNGRCFTFSSGLGLDASVVRRVDSNPHLKARFGAWYFTAAAVGTFTRRYLVSPPHLIVEANGESHTGVTAIVQNGAPFTYFKDRPIEVAQGPALDSGTLAGCVLRRARPLDMPSIAFRAFSKRARIVRHRQVVSFPEVAELTVSSADNHPLPLQVDGDYVGDVLEARYSLLPRALNVVA